MCKCVNFKLSISISRIQDMERAHGLSTQQLNKALREESEKRAVAEREAEEQRRRRKGRRKREEGEEVAIGMEDDGEGEEEGEGEGEGEGEDLPPLLPPGTGSGEQREIGAFVCLFVVFY